MVHLCFLENTQCGRYPKPKLTCTVCAYSNIPKSLFKTQVLTQFPYFIRIFHRLEYGSIREKDSLIQVPLFQSIKYSSTIKTMIET